MNSKVDAFFEKEEKWTKELRALRKIVLETALTEDLKWGAPCYSFNGTNLIILGGLKDYCVLSFFKGALLTDSENLLQKPGPNTQSARIIPFTRVKDIIRLKPILKSYINEAIETEKAGLKVDFKEKHELKLPEELELLFKKQPGLKTAFQALTPGRQRAYNLYFTAPKQAKTRASRIEKCTSRILAGKGLTDR